MCDYQNPYIQSHISIFQDSDPYTVDMNLNIHTGIPYKVDMNLNIHTGIPYKVGMNLNIHTGIPYKVGMNLNIHTYTQVCFIVSSRIYMFIEVNL